jgi:hypothetical protein
MGTFLDALQKEEVVNFLKISNVGEKEKQYQPEITICLCFTHQRTTTTKWG